MTTRSPRTAGPMVRALAAVRIDGSTTHPHPAPRRLVAATAMALAGSLLSGALLVAAGTHLFPSTEGYAHFRFGDYGTLTVIGVLAACAAWPAVARVSPTPRWLFLRLATLATVVLWIPDLVILARGQPGATVGVLMAMHLGVATVTYNCLVRVAPATTASADPGHTDPERPARVLATALAAMVGAESVVGVATLASVGSARPTGWVPSQGVAVYLVHALLGIPLAAGALLLVTRARRSTRILRLTAWIGGAGVAAAGTGGILAAVHPARLVGIALMLLGAIVAGFGYLLPVFDRWSDDEQPG